MNKNILVTGCAGFIGFSTSKVLLQKGYKIYGVDNLNDYYSVKLKKDRIIEKKLNLKIKKKLLPFQKGDVLKTYANINKTKNNFNYNPKENIETGLSKFIKWYKKYKNIFDEVN